MITVTDILSAIYKGAVEIKTQADKAEANQLQCLALVNRSGALAVAVRGLDKRDNPEQYRPALVGLNRCLSSCQKIVVEYSRRTGRSQIFINFLKSDSIKKKFTDLTCRLDESIRDLTLALSAANYAGSEAALLATLERAEADSENLEKIITGLGGLGDKIEAVTEFLQETVVARFDSAKDRQLELLLEVRSQGQKASQAINELRLAMKMQEIRQQTQHEEIAKIRGVVAASTPTAASTKSADDYYEEGLKMEMAKQFTEAREAFQQAANRNHPRALTNLGYFMAIGLGGPKNTGDAHQCFLKAASLGYGKGMVNLAMQLEKGEEGIDQDFASAEYLYRQAALRDPNLSDFVDTRIRAIKARLFSAPSTASPAAPPAAGPAAPASPTPEGAAEAPEAFRAKKP